MVLFSINLLQVTRVIMGYSKDNKQKQSTTFLQGIVGKDDDDDALEVN